MAINLGKPLDNTIISNQEKHFMENLQANILKGHGREHVVLLFLAVQDVDKARNFLHHYPVTDSFTQHKETKNFKETGTSSGVVRLVFLSKAGVDVFGHGSKFAGFGAFSGGMAADTSVLDGGSTGSWQNELKRPIHVMLLVAYHNEIDLARIIGNMVEDFDEDDSPFEVIFVQEGRAYKNGDGEGIEHFGYVDGRSQPLMVQSAIDDETNKRRGGIDKYDPTAPLSQFILPDPLSKWNKITLSNDGYGEIV
jgi:deferrochelatase/peroxidase EfeB